MTVVDELECPAKQLVFAEEYYGKGLPHLEWEVLAHRRFWEEWLAVP